jgi:hypothetical protein
MSNTSYKTADLELERSVTKTRISYWENRLSEIEYNLNQHITVSDFTYLARERSNAIIRLDRLKSKLAAL